MYRLLWERRSSGSLSAPVGAAKPRDIPWDPVLEGGPGGVCVLQPCPAGAAGQLVRAGTSWALEGHSGLLGHCPVLGSSRNLSSQSLQALQPGRGMGQPDLSKSWLEERPHLEVPSCAEMLRVWRGTVYQELGGCVGRFCYTHTVPMEGKQTPTETLAFQCHC